MDFLSDLPNESLAILNRAGVIALMSNAKTINTAHVALSVLEQSIRPYLLEKYSINLPAMRKWLGVDLAKAATPNKELLKITNSVRSAVIHANQIARNDGHECNPAHILYSIMLSTESLGRSMLASSGLTGIKLDNFIEEIHREAIKPSFLANMDNNSLAFDWDGSTNILELDMNAFWKYFDDMVRERGIDPKLINNYNPDRLDNMRQAGEVSDRHEFRNSDNKSTIIERYSRNLTELASARKLDPLIGRQSELDRLMTVLGRRTKNNPILIGEAGVGKTAIVEGLAQRIVDGEVPSFLADCQIIEIDLPAIVAGTKYRGEFEERLMRLVSAIEKDNNLIAFIDEIHLLVGAGNSEDSMDAANILKPALARGKLRLIGATTNDEYRRKIEPDTALMRRLQEIEVAPPSSAETATILRGIVSKYTAFHNVSVSDDIIDEIVRVSDRYINNDRYQPDKAIDVLDETATQVRIKNDNYTKRNSAKQSIQRYQIEIEKLSSDMEQAVSNQDYEKAAICKMRVSQLKDKISGLTSRDNIDNPIAITSADVSATVSKMTGIPLSQLKESDAKKLIDLEKHLSARVVGQPKAIKAVAQAIRRSRAGVSDGNRPIGSFIFLGPTGVGKTELARVLADEMFGSVNNLIKIDMSEFSEKHTMARLVGAPAGYVGYEDGGQLTNKVRRQPYSVILFDEIEKAHPEVFNMLLQIIEDGVLTDGHGKKVDFRNCIIILTSNIGASKLSRQPLGFSSVSTDSKSQNLDKENEVMKSLRQTMRPELINRFDKIVVFNSLDMPGLKLICNLLLDELKQRLIDKEVHLSVTNRLIKHLIDRGVDDKYGARPLRRLIQDTLEVKLSDQIISGSIKPGDFIAADYIGGELVLKKSAKAANSKKSLKPVK